MELFSALSLLSPPGPGSEKKRKEMLVFFKDTFLWMDNEYVQFSLMLYCGLLGGCMYVNVAYSILSDLQIENDKRELCMNIMSLAVNIGISLSSFYELLMDNTWFSGLIDGSH